MASDAVASSPSSQADARRWLATVSGSTTVRPLSGDSLRAAFAYFDKDGSGLISLLQLEAGLQQLGFPGLDSVQARKGSCKREL